MLGTAARLLGMDLSEARDPVGEFGSLDELFVRRLRPGARRWPAAGAAASPVDGVVGQSGAVRAGRVLQAKGREYTVAELLDDRELAERFQAGSYLTLYLAPRHYHRIHAPVSGRLRRARHVPGRLLPVNAPAVRLVDRLFPRNERLIAVLEREEPDGPGEPAEPAAPAELEEPEEGEEGEEGGEPEATPDASPEVAPDASPESPARLGGTGAVAVVAVGAFNVGRITADFDAELVTNRRGARAETHVYHPPVAVERGDPLMAFHLGSTVVLLFERQVQLHPALQPGAPIRLGDRLTE